MAYRNVNGPNVLHFRVGMQYFQPAHGDGEWMNRYEGGGLNAKGLGWSGSQPSAEKQSAPSKLCTMTFDLLAKHQKGRVLEWIRTSATFAANGI